MIVPIPEFKIKKLDEDDSFFILGSDGVLDGKSDKWIC